MDVFKFSEYTVPFWTAVAALAAVGTVCVTSIYTYLTLKLFRAQAEPKVILYVKHDRTRTTIMMLVIENIGKDVAFDVQFKPSRPIPMNAFGLSSDSAETAAVMKDGPLVDGIPSLEPGGSRVISWGQCGGLTKALEGKSLVVDISYSHGARRLKSQSTLEVSSFLNNDASDLPINMIPKKLDDICKHLRRIEVLINPLVVKDFEKNEPGDK
jgi:hypothetical protein